MEVGGYSMHLYCRHKDRAHPWRYLPHEFIAQTRGQCVRSARKRGWKFHRDGEVSCPLCNGKKT